MKYFFQNLKNIIDFYLRQHFKFSRKNYTEKNEPKECLFLDENIIPRESELIGKYDLTSLKNDSTQRNYLENLYTIDLLDRFLPVAFKENLSVLDIGCKNWFYAKSEYYFFKKYCSSLKLDGIELDASRLYNNFYSREEVAKFYIKDLINTDFIAGDFLKHEGKYDFIVWILPFVFEEPLMKWGLPQKYFHPEKMLAHAYNLLSEGGKIFIINQGESEFNAQKELCDSLKLTYFCIKDVESKFLSYKFARHIVLVNK